MSRTFQVEPAQTAVAAALNAAGVHRSAIYYDVLDHIEDLLMPGELKARTLSGMTWSLDMLILNMARSVFFETYEIHMGDNPRTSDSLNEFIEAMRGLAANDKLNLMDGRDHTNYGTLCILMKMRDAWYDDAQKAATSMRPVQMLTLDEQLIKEKVQELDPMSRAKMEQMASFAAEGDAEVSKTIMERLQEAQKLRFQKTFEMNQRIRPALRSILMHASGYALISDEQMTFYNLPVAAQVRLIEAAIRSIDRAMSDLSTNRKVTLQDFATYLRDGGAAMKALKAVLAEPKFAEHNQR